MGTSNAGNASNSTGGAAMGLSGAEAKLISETSAAHLQIPAMNFEADVRDMVRGIPLPVAAEALASLRSKYSIMDNSLLHQHEAMATQLSEVLQSIAALKRIKARRADHPEADNMRIFYRLDETVLSEAELDLRAPPKVVVWVGTATAVEYELDEALEFLDQQKRKYQRMVEEYDSHIDFLRCHATRAETAISRLHNYRVHLRDSQPEALEEQKV